MADEAARVRAELERAGVTASEQDLELIAAFARRTSPPATPRPDIEPAVVSLPRRWARR